MRILYNSKDKKHKSKFGTLRENEGCNICIHIPSECKTKEVTLVFKNEDSSFHSAYFLKKKAEDGYYEIYSCDFSIAKRGLYFYYFVIKTENEQFSLYKQGYDMTNMEEGELWQISCVPENFDVPSVFKGSIMYQIFPDRFCRLGQCDLTNKLKPFTVHDNTMETPQYLPDEDGIVQNNDFFGGNIKGIISKLDYLKDLNVDVIYLNPVFKAFSNHRYDTADYMQIDEMLGDENDFAELCEEAHKRNIKIILDGVFSHTGSNSVYFDAENVFGNGAVSTPDSPYREWFDFKSYPDEYTAWWGIKTLPCVNENNESYKDYIINNDDSVVAHWLKVGADGFRLDVADELPDSFIYELRTRMKQIKNSSLLVGEVWEDASNKCSYGVRRKYFTDGELDSVMNYPFRNAIIDFCLERDNGYGLKNTVMTLAENYPEPVLNTLMNIISTHDTARILTVLGAEDIPEQKIDRAKYKLSENEYEKGVCRLLCAVFLQFILPGMPCIYYGDEIGTEGFEDPFCRSFFDWSKTEGNMIMDFYSKITKLKSENDILKFGSVCVDIPVSNVVRITRSYKDRQFTAVVNISDSEYFEEKDGKIIMCEKVDFGGENISVQKYGFFCKID